MNRRASTWLLCACIAAWSGCETKGDGADDGTADGDGAGTDGASGDGKGGDGSGGDGKGGDGSGGDGKGSDGAGGDGADGGSGGQDLPPVTGTDGKCKAMAGGKFALRTRIDVWWGMEGAVTKPGRGDVVTYLLADNTTPDAENKFASTVQVCKVEIPTFVAGPVCEAYLAEFGTWESVPAVKTDGRFGCFEPDCDVGLGEIKVFAGIRMSDEHGAWPSPSETGTFACPDGTGAECFPDDEGDGKPGVTATMRTSGTYKDNDTTCLLNADRVYKGAPPATIEALLPGAPRVKQLYLGVRTLLDSTAFKLDASCALTGGLASAEAVNARALSCLLTDDKACNDAQETYVDEKLPVYTTLNAGDKPPAKVGSDPIDDQSEGRAARIEAVRLGDSSKAATCADVLAAFSG